jgi:hypothetical protein
MCLLPEYYGDENGQEEDDGFIYSIPGSGGEDRFDHSIPEDDEDEG